MLPKAFDAFLQQRPVAVMARAVVERFFQPERLDALFERTAEKQYRRTLLFSSVVELMHSVVLGVEPSVYAAYRRRRPALGVTDQAVYDKIDGTELGLSAALVSDSARLAAPVIDALNARRDPWLPGYRTRILDGNHLAATEHRLAALRATWAAPLPGRALVVMEPDTGLATDVFLTPDGHASERSLLDDVLRTVRERDVWVADRNFCTLKFLCGIAGEKAFFIIRQHGTVKGELHGKRRFLGEGSTGQVYEQQIDLTFDGETRTFRRLTVELREPTRDGDMVLHLLSNLPADIAGLLLAELYRKRWLIETLFYDVTQTLSCEIDTLCYPRAALFVFCLALMAANAVAVLKAALRAAHGAEVADELSGYYMALEIKQAHDGMMIALPPAEWHVFGAMSATAFARALKDMATRVDLAMHRKSRRGPKKPPPEMDTYKNGGHVSTHKLLTAKDP